MKSFRKQILLIALVFLLSPLFLFSPEPPLDIRAWKLLGSFLFAILSIILKLLPMGFSALAGLAIAVGSRAISIEDGLSGFSSPVIWLIVLAFFISRAVIKTKFGERIALHIISYLGSTSLGLGYGIVFADILLALGIPSNTARSGGVLYPIILSISSSYESYPDKNRKKIGAYLMQIAFQAVVVSGALFLTAMAGNPLAVQLAKEYGITITWIMWAKYAAIPGIITALSIPILLYYIYPPECTTTPEAPNHAKSRLAIMGRMKKNEWGMAGIFLFLIVFWVIGASFSINATVVALIGLVLLLFSGILDWDDILQEKSAWDTLIWYSLLYGLASKMGAYGLTKMLANSIAGIVGFSSPELSLIVVGIIYVICHYFFASNVAHISALYAPFLAIAITLGVHPLYAALYLGFLSNLFGTLTHYGCGPAPIIYGAHFVTLQEWWKLGAFFAGLYFVIWSSFITICVHYFTP